MTDINHVMLIGRLTRDLGDDERSFSYVANGQARANVSIAVNRSKRNGDQWIDEVNYFDITIWGKTAENLRPYLQKGKQIAVEGYLKQDRWEKDGQKLSKITITATNVQLLGGRTDGGGSPNSGQYSGGTSSFQPRPQNSIPSYPDNYSNDSFGGTGSDFPEDIPF